MKTDPIFEDSALPLDVWFVAIWSVANCKNGISSYELARATGITQKSAGQVLYRIRIAMDAGGLTKLGGTVKADETYGGGHAKNMHAKVRKHRVIGRGAGDHKMLVMGMMQRTDVTIPRRVVARVIKAATSKNDQGLVRKHVEPGSALMTDAAAAYLGLSADYVHQRVNHADEYVRGNVHTNGIENFWSMLKRSVTGTYVSVDSLHLQAYVGEQVFRFNERKGTDLARFRSVLGSVACKRLTWKDLTNHALSAAS